MKKKISNNDWLEKWFGSVKRKTSNMSQRSLKSLEKEKLTLRFVASEAKRHKIHLLLLEVDQGKKVIAASLKPFKVLS